VRGPAPLPPRGQPDGAVSIPIEGTGMEVGVEFGNDSVTLSARPSPEDDERPAPREPSITVPLPPPDDEDPRPPEE